MRPQSTRLENFYFFFDARSQLEAAADKIFCSAWIDAARIEADAILWPQLRECRTICVANKQHNDCVYFSEIDVDQLAGLEFQARQPAGGIAELEVVDHGPTVGQVHTTGHAELPVPSLYRAAGRFPAGGGAVGPDRINRSVCQSGCATRPIGGLGLDLGPNLSRTVRKGLLCATSRLCV